jgi:hypothetical protein
LAASPFRSLSRGRRLGWLRPGSRDHAPVDALHRRSRECVREEAPRRVVETLRTEVRPRRDVGQRLLDSPIDGDGCGAISR